MINPTQLIPDRRPARRVRDLAAADWLLLAEALATLAAASAAIRVLPFRRVVQLARFRVARPRPRGSSNRDLDQAIWAVQAVARRVPWRTVCFQKGLALHWLLRRRQIPSLLHYGVGKEENGGLAAHVWISVDGMIVLGGDVVDRFRCLATYPAQG